MMRSAMVVAVCGLAAGSVQAQMDPNLGAAGSIVRSMRAGEPGSALQVRQPIVASLSYDGTSSWGAAGQDFESAFDMYDTFVVERFGIVDEARLTEFRSVGFGTSNPFGMTDVRVEIYGGDRRDEICDDGTLPSPLMTSVDGSGFYDGTSALSDFGGQCLGPGEYYIRWGAEMNFTTFGQIFFFVQRGPHDHGLGSPNDAFQSNPGNGFGMGECFIVFDGDLGTGVNFVLCGDVGDCGAPCPDPDGCGDWGGDGVSDSDDLFLFLASFLSRDPCADLNGDGSIDSDDFFGYLDRFLHPC